MKLKKSIALLCDYGLDDAIATLYLFKHCEKFEKIDILPVGGNFPLEETFVNTKRLLTYADRLPGNVRIVDTSCVQQRSEAIYEIHGSDGMGDVMPCEYKEPAEVIDYSRWIEEVDDSYVIVSLGPCSVTRDILKNKGELPLIMMAGNIGEPPNYNGYEFNHGMDKEAFEECVKYPHAIATLDTCHCDMCNLNLYELEGNDLFGKLLVRYRELSQSRKETMCSVYDMTAIVYLIYPERFTVCTQTDMDGNTLSVLKYVYDKPIIR